MGVASKNISHTFIPNTLREAFFEQSPFLDVTDTWNFDFCPEELICTNSDSGSNICTFDDGSPLYKFECGSLKPSCLYGIASFFKSKDESSGKSCDNGSYFASIPYFHDWIVRTVF